MSRGEGACRPSPLADTAKGRTPSSSRMRLVPALAAAAAVCMAKPSAPPQREAAQCPPHGNRAREHNGMARLHEGGLVIHCCNVYR